MFFDFLGLQRAWEKVGIVGDNNRRED